jgi:tRNA-uridine aminocarboxypropyltransferase
MTEQPAAGAPQASPADPNAECPHCLKRRRCACAKESRGSTTRCRCLFLQHPQEQDRQLGTARLTALHFKDALLKIGLSWPSLTKIQIRVP